MNVENMWRDDRIQATIDAMTGFIVARMAESFSAPVHVIGRKFLSSKAYEMLCDTNTGLYADNVWETVNLFLREAENDLRLKITPAPRPRRAP